MNPSPTLYDFNHPVFRKMRQYIRLAKEHLSLLEINQKSDVIFCEPVETTGPLEIPVKYHVHFKLKSITGIEDNQQPVYGNHHIMEVSLPPRYPLEPCKIYMITDIWHPNIKSNGRFKGRICGNLKNFGKTYDLYQLVLRVAEILQYKNYHAIHVQPFPEDSTVAHWVTSFAEPNGIVNKEEAIFVDDTPLLILKSEEETIEVEFATETSGEQETDLTNPPSQEAEFPEEKKESETTDDETNEDGEQPPEPKIKLGSLRKAKPGNSKFKIKPKDPNQ